jgi:hypothetical protein
MQRVLEAAGIEPKVRLTSLQSEPVTDCSTYLFNNGSTQLYGMVPDKGGAGVRRVRVTLSEDRAVYDVRRKEYVGFGDSFETEIEPASPRLFAFVAGRGTDILLDAPTAAKPGETVHIGYRVQGINGLKSVATAVVTDPNGRELHYYGRNMDVVESVGSFSFQTALNDPVGPWRIVITDTITGLKKEAVVALETAR